MHNFTRIGTLGIIALIALRVGIGWHFFKEGTDKIKSGTFSSDGFLKSAQGRMAGFYHGLVWDHAGRIRLDKKLISEKIKEGEKACIAHFGLTDQQAVDLQKRVKMLEETLNDIHARYSDAIIKLQRGQDRLDQMENSATWRNVTSLREQKVKIEKDLAAGVAPALQEMDDFWQRVNNEFNQGVTEQQMKASGRFYLKRPKEGIFTSAVVDRIIPVFDITIGVLLIIGLFVPLAGWAGALFLLSVVLAQFPGDPYTQPTYAQAIEGLALVALASIGAGRFGGLDFIFWARRQKRGSVA